MSLAEGPAGDRSGKCGCDISRLRARPLTGDAFDNVDVIFAIGHVNLHLVQSICPHRNRNNLDLKLAVEALASAALELRSLPRMREPPAPPNDSWNSFAGSRRTGPAMKEGALDIAPFFFDQKSLGGVLLFGQAVHNPRRTRAIHRFGAHDAHVGDVLAITVRQVAAGHIFVRLFRVGAVAGLHASGGQRHHGKAEECAFRRVVSGRIGSGNITISSIFKC